MITLFENDDFVLKSTGHDYDFVGIIETKTNEPLTFFFSEAYIPHTDKEELEWTSWDYEDNIDESKTEFLEVWKGLKPYDYDNENPSDDEPEDEEEDRLLELRASYPDAETLDFFRTRDDRSTGFLSCPKEKGYFLAIIKAFCPDKLKEIDWA